MVEQVPVIKNYRRDAREQARHRMHTRLGGIGGVAAALGITAIVVMAPMAQGANAGPTYVAPASLPVVTTVHTVTAPLVTHEEALELPTFTLNPPPPAPKVHKAHHSPAPVAADDVAGDDGGGGCSGHHSDGEWDPDKPAEG